MRRAMVATVAAYLPIAGHAATLRPAPFAAHLAQCAGKDGWADPAPPVRIFGDTYDVGTCGIVAVLVVGDGGAVLIDGGPVAAAPLVAANIERLGLRLADVKLILSTHEHGDHAGGLAELRRRTGARLAARRAERASLETGVMAADDPQRDGDRPDHPGVPVDRVLRDGEMVRLGTLRLTAHATPGHTPGGTSWTWRSCAGGICRDIAYADSLSAISVDGYRFTDHPARVAALRASFATVAALRCDLVVTPHPAASNLYARLAGRAPLVDPQGCSRLAATSAAKWTSGCGWRRGASTSPSKSFNKADPGVQTTSHATQHRTLLQPEVPGSSSRVATPNSGCMTKVQPSPPTIIRRSAWRSAAPSSEAAPAEAASVTVLPSWRIPVAQPRRPPRSSPARRSRAVSKAMRARAPVTHA